MNGGRWHCPDTSRNTGGISSASYHAMLAWKAQKRIQIPAYPSGDGRAYSRAGRITKKRRATGYTMMDIQKPAYCRLFPNQHPCPGGHWCDPNCRWKNALPSTPPIGATWSTVADLTEYVGPSALGVTDTQWNWLYRQWGQLAGMLPPHAAGDGRWKTKHPRLYARGAGTTRRS